MLLAEVAGVNGLLILPLALTSHQPLIVQTNQYQLTLRDGPFYD